MFSNNSSGSGAGEWAGPIPSPVVSENHLKSKPNTRYNNTVDSTSKQLPLPRSRWDSNPISLPPRLMPVPISQSRAAGQTQMPSELNCINDNWVDLEELYKWLQELEDTKIEAYTGNSNFGKKILYYESVFVI